MTTRESPARSPEARLRHTSIDRRGGHTVLVVEDDLKIRSAVRHLLEPEGYRVIEVGNGKDAIDLAAAVLPDVILMDLGLPGLNGLDAAAHLGSQSSTCHIPVIAVTGSWLGAQDGVLRSVGFRASLTKPFKSQQLLAELDRVLIE